MLDASLSRFPEACCTGVGRNRTIEMRRFRLKAGTTCLFLLLEKAKMKRFLFVLALAVMAARESHVQLANQFEVRDEMIPARDGVRLNTKILHSKGPLGSAADHPATNALRRRGSSERIQPVFQGTRGGWLHFRFSGYPRKVQV